MKAQELIEKLKTFPPNERAKFYCPVNKTYYYAYFIDFPKYTIELKLNSKAGFKYCDLIYLLQNMQDQVKFSHNNQVFITL